MTARREYGWVGAAAALLLIVSGAAHAAPDGPGLDEAMAGLDRTGTPPAPGQLAAQEPVPPLPGEKRALPSYDGRAPEPAELGETLIWAPRVVLFPVHAVAEYGLRRPLVASLSWAEEHHAFARIERVFTWWDGRAGIFPTFRFDLGLDPAVGFRAFGHGVLHPDNDLVASASFWDDQHLSLAVQDGLRVFPGGAGILRMRASYLRRPDVVFYGLGPDTTSADRTRYFTRQMEVGTGFEGRLGGLNRVSFDLAARGARFEGARGPGGTGLPPGFTDGHALLSPRLRLVLDSRRPYDERLEGTGVRLELDAAYAMNPGRRAATSFVAWGAEAAGLWDVSGHNHVLGLRLAARFTDNLGDEPIPFTELPSLGGAELLRGFLAGRLIGDSALEATLEYRYPVWSFLDAELFSSVGNVFDGHLRGVAAQRLFAAYGLSLRTTFSRDSALALTVAGGSTRFDADDFRLTDTARVFVGLNQGF